MSESPEIALQPCPFCGGAAVGITPIYDHHSEEVPDAFGISCFDCQFDFAVGDSTAEDIAAVWNQRPGKETA